MRFVVDASLPRASASLIIRYGHEAVDVRDAGFAAAADSIIAQYAKTNQLVLMSADFDFADIRVYPPAEYSGIVVIDRPVDAPVSVVLGLIERLLSETLVLASLPGRLAIVGVTRIRLRPPLPEQESP